MSIAAAFAKNLPREATTEDAQEIEDALDAAAEWATKALPLWEFAQVGTMLSPLGKPSSGYTRHVALLTTKRADPRWNALREAIDALLVFQGYRLTNWGLFAADELKNVTIRYDKESAPWE